MFPHYVLRGALERVCLRLFEQAEEACSSAAVPQRWGARTGRGAERRENFFNTRTKSASAPLYVDHSTGEILREYDPIFKWQL